MQPSHYHPLSHSQRPSSPGPQPVLPPAVQSTPSPATQSQSNSQTTSPAAPQAQASSQTPPSDTSQGESRARARASDWDHPPDGVYKNTPVKPKPSSTSRHALFATGDDQHKKRRIALDKEMRWDQYAVQEWFERCMPGTNAPPGDMHFQAMEVAKDGPEPRMYRGIHEGCVGYLNTVGCTEFTVRCTDSQKDKAASKVVDVDNLVDYNADRPDLVVFPTHSDALDAYRLKDKVKQAETSVAGGSPQDSPSAIDPAHLEVSDDPDVAQPSLVDPFQDFPGEGGPNPGPSEAQDAPAFRGRMSWAWAEVIIEAKRSRNKFPFLHGTDGKESMFLPQGEEHVLARGQIADYAVEVFKHQHRLFLFTILILDDHARLVCFDRKGAMVSQAFDYRKHPAILGEFFYRGFNPDARREQRGHDPTASLASKDEKEAFLNAHKAFANVPITEQALKRAAAHPQSYPIYKIDMAGMWSADGTPLTTESPGTQSTHVCLVGRPESCSASLVGRGTKGFVALDMGVTRDDGGAPEVHSASNAKAPKAIFIKETWRPDSDDIIPEGEHYKVMWSKALQEKTANAPPHARKAYIPTPVCMGDVVSPGTNVPNGNNGQPGGPSPSGTSQTADVPRIQRTLPRNDATSDDNLDIPRIHHRLALKEICRTLEDFSDPYELMIAVFLALVAHRFAWEKCGILHRDISIGNILLCYFEGRSTGTRVGLLSDWDLAKTKEQLQKQKATQPSRSGTWQFMSALLQMYANKPHELADDLESFLHVLNWCALKYFPHHRSGERWRANLAEMFFSLFDKAVRDPPYLAQLKTRGVVEMGYVAKLDYVQNGQMVVQGLPEGHPFTVLLADFTAIIRKHYDTIDFADLDTSIPPEQPSTTSAIDLLSDDWLPPDPDELQQEMDQETEMSAQGSAAAATEVPSADPSSSSVLPTRSAAVSPLQSHSDIMRRFHKLTKSAMWEGAPTLVKIADQVPFYVPPVSLFPAISSGSKRSRDTTFESSSAYGNNVFPPRPGSSQPIVLDWVPSYTPNDPFTTMQNDRDRASKRARTGAGA